MSAEGRGDREKHGVLDFSYENVEGSIMMSELEKQEINSRVNAISKEEKELVASVIPVDICQNRITAEIERLLTLEKKVKSLC